MINNRQQNGRRRGRGGNGGGSGGGGGQRNGNPGRPDSGNRIDSRARGNANQLFEKYRNLARDAQMSGDRVNTEYYLQFADHYFRVLSESRSRFEDQNQQQPRRQSNDSFDAFDGDEEYGDEGEPIRASEQVGDDQRGNPREQSDGREPRDGRDNGREPRDNREGREPRDGRDNREPRDSRAAGDTREPRESRDRPDARDVAPRGGGDRDQRRGNGAPSHGGADERPARPAAPTSVPAAPAGLPAAVAVANDLDEAPAAVQPAEPEVRRARRPRRDRVVVEADAEAEAPVLIEADRLPPALSAAIEPAGDVAEEEPKPRRRRLRTVNAGDTTQTG